MSDDDETSAAEQNRLGELFVSTTGESTTREPQEDAAPKRVRDTTTSDSSTVEE